MIYLYLLGNVVFFCVLVGLSTFVMRGAFQYVWSLPGWAFALFVVSLVLLQLASLERRRRRLAAPLHPWLSLE